MIYTGSYNNCLKERDIKLVSISGDRGKRIKFTGEYYSKLAPKRDFWLKWHNNFLGRSEIENNRFYISEYMIQVLSKLDSEKVYTDLDNSILLCYEESSKFCHRHIVASWLEYELGIIVPEVRIISGKMSYLERPKYIKEIYEQEKYLIRKYR